MIAYIKGKITHKSRTAVIVEAAGVGYWIEISLHTYNKIVHLDEVQLLTTQIIREDAHTLYGFAEGDEKAIFEQLISVSGVGANTARILTSALSPGEIRAAIIAEKEEILRNAKGIGPKNAKRIILELKDKLLKDSGATSEAIAGSLSLSPMGENLVREEALSAMVALGFNKIQVQKTLNAILKTNPTISDSGDLIKMALSQLT
jgi:Holliday junction DNA helicase RuvA